MDDASFRARLEERAAETNAMLDRLLSASPLAGELRRPSRLVEAMRYAVLDGGKRLRPFLAIETATMLGGDHRGALRLACAIELVHGYSLVHDDLPAMDDDDLRRGKPTVHRAFDEATAILAGDALQTLAFDILAGDETHREPAVRIELVRLLARAAGMGGMVGGQVLDMAAEEKSPDRAGIELIQAMKTGALIRLCCEAGAVLARASDSDRNALERFGRLLGQAFQLIDDVLDVTAGEKALGKRAAKDAQRGKATLVALYGVEACRREARAILDRALAELRAVRGDGSWLAAAARFTIERSY